MAVVLFQIFLRFIQEKIELHPWEIMASVDLDFRLCNIVKLVLSLRASDVFISEKLCNFLRAS